MLEIDYSYAIDDCLPDTFIIADHLGGFTQNGKNQFLQKLNDQALSQRQKFCVIYHQILEKQITNCYPEINILFSAVEQNNKNLSHFVNYNIHPEVTFKNFICSFNGSPHVSRKLLVSALEKFRWFNPMYCSKNFSYSTDILDGHINDYVDDRHNFYRKFFVSCDSETFFNTINSFGHVRYNHTSNIYNLENKLTESFLHIVSETMATSYHPFVTEKFLYSVVTRGLFLAYAQPGWHAHLEKYYGFKRYTRLFDYRFDTIENPIERLVELMSMISKFSILSTDDWQDLYELEKDTIEYNYEHYFSQNYLKSLELYV
jgi:hypothetical protein